ncbi:MULTISPECIES: SDR family oxidoreductase [unclassified Actinomyces]|uniref:SDR family oxidoreductase n=1 Tax=unclassified Actinomyces TaxID=2609248 RepID=UPI002017CB03|nr:MULTISPECIES: SDR family oxidoreductase [unclassified Actinomyces]MCL3778717.1 SDR family oxidoreductase [Actinomyces sp. AC-20-1]MCL3789208.1 SDR family oxidoreductase [Actinomyces sp. 187325]MCL3791395.1 SDR family oxidoreductase [Actinomyces sp. 186855]MCL3793580.1 SDR family oxidoreductase [Actinomyces sp. 217892]
MSSTRTPVIAVTGATGRVGGAVAARLHDAGLGPRLIVRDATRAPAWADNVAVTTYGDREAGPVALAGVDVLLMVSASEAADRLEQHRALIDSAAEAGVRHVVYTSFLGAGEDSVFTFGRTHGATEAHLAASGMTTTLLRDSFYLDFLPELAVNGVIAGPAGPTGGRVGAVARADVVRSAAAVLTDLATGSGLHDGAVYTMTGPEALSLTDVARTLTVLGPPTTYREESLEQAYASRAGYGAPAWQVDGWVSTYTAIASGQLAAVTDDVHRLTGRAPLSLAEVLTGARP